MPITPPGCADEPPAWPGARPPDASCYLFIPVSARGPAGVGLPGFSRPPIGPASLLPARPGDKRRLSGNWKPWNTCSVENPHSHSGWLAPARRGSEAPAFGHLGRRFAMPQPLFLKVFHRAWNTSFLGGGVPARRDPDSRTSSIRTQKHPSRPAERKRCSFNRVMSCRPATRQQPVYGQYSVLFGQSPPVSTSYCQPAAPAPTQAAPVPATTSLLLNGFAGNSPTR